MIGSGQTLARTDDNLVAGVPADRFAHIGLDGQLVSSVTSCQEDAVKKKAFDGCAHLDQAVSPEECDGFGRTA